MESVRGIGQLARESGLTVSALRFYDSAGVLRPAHVDPRSGYRTYDADQLVVARLVATLRRVGMPLAGIREVLAVRHDLDAVGELLAGHLRRLEHGLADARRALSSVRPLLDPEENPMAPTTVTLAAADLVAAIRAVRFAVGSDPELPVLGGVLFDVTTGSVTLVATDRYRLAVASAPVTALDGRPVSAVLPAAFADALVAAGGTTVTIVVDGAAVSATAGGIAFDGTALPDAYPDYRRLLPGGGREVPVTADLRAAVAAGPTRSMTREHDGVEYEVTVLSVGDDGAVSVAPDGDGVAVNREFLLEALDAGGGDGQLVLALDGPVTPLTIRGPRSTSLLMPVRR